MDKKQNRRRRETAAAKPQESWAVQPGAGSEDAGAKEGYLMGGVPDGRGGGPHCAGAGGPWGGGAIGQPRRGWFRAGPSFERCGLEEPLQRRGAQREEGSRGTASEEAGSGRRGVWGGRV